MCWRDDIRTDRRCEFCGAYYFGDLGHRDCPTFAPKPEPEPLPASAPESKEE